MPHGDGRIGTNKPRHKTIDELRREVERTGEMYIVAQEVMNAAGYHMRVARANYSRAQHKLHEACVEQARKDGKAKHLSIHPTLLVTLIGLTHNDRVIVVWCFVGVVVTGAAWDAMKRKIARDIRRNKPVWRKGRL